MSDFPIWFNLFAGLLIFTAAVSYYSGLTKGVKLKAQIIAHRPPSPFPRFLCLLLSVVLILASIGTLIYSIYFLSNSIKTEATITNLTEHTDEAGETFFLLSYSYSTADGATHQGSRNSHSPYKVGEKIVIRYLIHSPHKSRPHSFNEHWAASIALCIGAIILAIVSVMLRWWQAKEQDWANNYLQKQS